MHFFIPMKQIPTVTSQEKGINFDARRIYTKTSVLSVKAKYKALLAPHRPETPLRGAVRLLVIWQFPVTGNHKPGDYKTSKPDTDNLIKLLKDVMTELGFWKDDAQVAWEFQQKMYADLTGVYFEIDELEV